MDLFTITIFFVSWMLIVSIAVFYISIRPFKIKTNKEPIDFGMNAEEVYFSSVDGLKLCGYFIANKKSDYAVIVMHGYPADKNNLLPKRYGFIFKKRIKKIQSP